jgi:hypothetical protein
MTSAEIYAHLADIAAQVDKQIRASGQLPANRAQLRYTRDRITDALGAMGLVNHNHRVSVQEAR